LHLLNTYRSKLHLSTALSLIHTLYSSLQHVLTLLSLLCLHRLSPDNGFQRRSFLSFRLHVLTGRKLSQLTPALLAAVSRLSRNHICSSLYILGTNLTESTASNRSSIVACICFGHYLATTVVYRAITHQRLLYSCLFCGRCLAMGLYAIIIIRIRRRFYALAPCHKGISTGHGGKVPRNLDYDAVQNQRKEAET
jgi:hypothetical protein